ncbi:putative Asc-type amino acid transporter 1 [Opisthorchis viverrini]|uniref:Putative Asc-type amino acid transporter 1 n=1 Tax=Opisthorchis viverrini TaxID=6198 RepID=A0A1S8X554_OPIVI|nr:putative Asc-type amino acid transporter 1 [Opisthorchis viverrini]
MFLLTEVIRMFLRIDPLSNVFLRVIPSTQGDDESAKLEVHKPEGARMEKSIGLVTSITIIVGSVIGSGIFVSPQFILVMTNSFGASIVVWIACGLFSLIGAYCYAELGTMMPRSGADYSYVYEAFGPFFGFLRLWIEVVVVRPVSAAVLSMVFANYVLKPAFPACTETPQAALRLIACVCVLLVGFINSLSVRWSARTQDVFTFAKVAALLLIIVTGLVQIGRGRIQEFQDPFEGSNWNPGNLAVAFYNGLFAYHGWNYLNCMIEEMKNPRRDLPIAIVFSCLLITAIYTMANVAYATVLRIPEILTSDAVAVSFANRIYGPAAWIMPIFVAFSTFGGVNGTIMTTSRMFFVAGQQSQMPKLLSCLHMSSLTPIPAVVFTCIFTIVYVVIGEVGSLITYMGFVLWLAIGISVLIVIIFRFTRPTMERPVKVPIVFPFIYVGATLLLVIFAFVGAPTEALIGVAILASGAVVYLIGMAWRYMPESVHEFTREFDVFSTAQNLVFIVAFDFATLDEK